MGTCMGTCMGVVLVILIPNQHISILQFIVFTEQHNTEKLYEVQPAWHQVLVVVAAHQTICRGEIRMKTFLIGPAVLCDMPMPNIILVIGSNGRLANSPRAHTYIIMRGCSQFGIPAHSPLNILHLMNLLTIRE